MALNNTHLLSYISWLSLILIFLPNKKRTVVSDVIASYWKAYLNSERKETERMRERKKGKERKRKEEKE